MRIRIHKRLLLQAVALTLVALPAQAKCGKAVTETIRIDAPPEVIFQTIRQYRTSCINHRKLVTFDGKQAVVEETLESVPIYGKVHCIWVERETPFERIDYELLNSDKFASGSGHYVIHANKEHEGSTLELSTTLDSGCHLPFSSEVGRVASQQDIKRRLEYIKKKAESSTIAENPKLSDASR